MQSVRIRADDDIRHLPAATKIDTEVGGIGEVRRDCFLNDVVDLQWREVENHLTGLQLLGIQYVIDKPDQALRVFADNVQRMPPDH